MSGYKFTASCELNMEGVEELFKTPKRYMMRMVLNNTKKEIKELCKNKDAEFVLEGNRFKVLDFPTYFKEGEEQGIYLNVEQIN